MPSYVNLLVPLAMLVISLVLARWLVRRQTAARRGWATAAFLACLAVGVTIALMGGPGHLIAAQSPAQPPSHETAGPEQDAGTAAPGDARAPASDEEKPASTTDEPASADQEKASAPEQETGASETGEAAAQPEAEQADAGKAQAKIAAGVMRTLDLPAKDLKSAPRIESPLTKGFFNLFLLILSLTVLIGPFFLGLRLTGSWRQPLWGWPVGLVLFGAVCAAVVFLARMVMPPLPPAFSYDFARYLIVLVSLRDLWIAVGLVAAAIWLGAYLSRKWRMPDYATRIAVVVFCLLAGIVVTVLGWPPKLGIDLSGGVILVYELEGQPGGAEPEEGDVEEGAKKAKEEGGEADQEETAAARPEKVDMDKLIQAVRLRADPSNVRELTIRPRGDRQIEVIVPEADEEELARIKRKISSAGTLEFRILANQRDNGSVIEQAKELEGQRVLRDSDGNLLAWWVPVARGREEDLISFSGRAETVYRKRTYRDYEWTEFLVVKDMFDVTGRYLVRAEPSIDQSGRPNVLFTFNQRGGLLFGALTGNNRPDESQDFSRHLGIILDGYLQSAPSIKTTIFERGEIVGDFTRKKVQDLVDILNAGSLPTALSEDPISEMYMGPGLGQDTIDRAKIAIAFSMAAVVAFMLIYYRFAGLVACLALLMNLVMILAIMISIRAAFTLPGLAGLVLTVGMAVDANVLIFERIREELAKQSTLRMAIRNGFGRATSAIVDANLTTLITATVLYVVGTDQIKGFAVTLWLGVVLSMFTAIYCSRVVFDVGEKQKWITRLRMLQMLGKTQIDFLGMRRLAVAGSLVMIVIGLGAVGLRGSGLLDIDFTGGVSVQTLFTEPQEIADIRTELGETGEGLQDLAVMNVSSLDQAEANRQFVINTSGPRDMKPDTEPDEILAQVEEHIKKAFGKQLAHYSMEFTVLPAESAVSRTGEPPTERGANQTSDGSVPGASLLASADLSAVLLLQGGSPEEGGASKEEKSPQEGETSQQGESPQDEVKTPEKETASPDVPQEAPATQPAPAGQSASAGPPGPIAPAKPPAAAPKQAAEASAEEPAAPATAKPAVVEAAAEKSANRTRAKLQFQNKLSYETLSDRFEEEISEQEKAGRLGPGARDFELFIDEGFQQVDPEAVRTTWHAQIGLPPQEGEALLAGIKGRIESEPIFPSSNTIGGQVARGMRVDAVAALLGSLVFIVGYIWIRFQRVMFGLAAVVALIHDVLITLGLIALTAFVAPYLGFLLIDEFKIGLSVLAAFLTIIGYSLNDTIVVFDRIREVRGKAPRLTAEMINTSINQTLSRTLLTSLTTLLVVAVLYGWGGQTIHVFAFALVVGVVVGTYSSIFVASPILYWMATGPERGQKGKLSPQTA